MYTARCARAVRAGSSQPAAIREAPGWLGERKVYLADASDEPVHGSDQADYRLHYAIGLFDPGMKEMALTGTEQGENVSNFKSFGAGDIVIRGPYVLQ
jgi:hypothetical protein